MKTKKYWICELDNMGQRTGEYESVDLPQTLVTKKNGLSWLRISNVHKSGYIAPAGFTLLYTEETQAQRAALS